MAYKILYIEDLDPLSIMADLTEQGFVMEHLNPGIFEDAMKIILDGKYDGILIDFRLTTGSNNAVFDAPTIAQTVRTKSSKVHIHTPIFLISSEKIISDYYDDITSNDLFDLSVSKEIFQTQFKKYSDRFKSIISAYESIQDEKFDLDKILCIPKDSMKIDYRIVEKLTNSHFVSNTYYICKFIYNQIIRSIGLLIGEQVLAARLGISLESKGWQVLKDSLLIAKYKGIFSDTYDRWWAKDVELFCDQEFGIKSLRRLNAKQRVQALEKSGFEDLLPIELGEFSESSNFWTICIDTKLPIDPIDGLELAKRDLFPWQEKEYISILAAFKTSDLYKYVKPIDKDRFQELTKR